MPSSMIDALARQLEPLPTVEDPWVIPELPTLVDALAADPDLRVGRGVSATLSCSCWRLGSRRCCGVRSLLGIARWIEGADRQLLVALGLDAEAVWTAPADSTLGRAPKASTLTRSTTAPAAGCIALSPTDARQMLARHRCLSGGARPGLRWQGHAWRRCRRQ